MRSPPDPPSDSLSGGAVPRDAVALSPHHSGALPSRRYQSAPLPFDPVLIAAGAGVAGRSVYRLARGWRRYPGSAQEICHAVVRDCWNGVFFAGSTGHFRQFWTRDLAMCTPALCRVGFRDQVVASWEWGLAQFERAGAVTTTIFARRYPRDVYAFATDSLPMLLLGLRGADAWHLVRRHRDFLRSEVQRYVERVFDRERGMVRSDAYFSAPRDCMIGRSTTFANTMVALLARLLDGDLDLPNPFAGYDLRKRLMDAHWTGDYFRDALDQPLPSGDANVWPFHLEIFTDLEMRRRAFAALEDRGFTRPVPLRYFERRLPASELPIPRLFTPNYQGDTSWTQIGPIYLRLLRDVDEPKMLAHRQEMARFIERDGNYLELYTPDGKPYIGRAGLYHADEGMIWASLFVDLYA